MEIIEIPQIEGDKRKRVAAYCRVSTKHEEQELSLETQKKYYEQYIKNNDMWEFAGVFFDSKSGLRFDKRNGLQELLSECDAGKVDIILVKSITRFGRNLYEGILILRHLKAIGVDVWFEQERMKLLQLSSSVNYELLLIFAEAESEGKSQNIKFGIKHGFKTGKSKIYNRICYGYDNDEFGNLIVNDYEAEIVRNIFSWYLNGFSLSEISKELSKQNIKSPTGKEKWSSETISKLLSNEKLTGSVIGQKTFVKDFHTGIQVKNNGELDRYFIKAHHTPIISSNCFQKVQEEKERRTNVLVDLEGHTSRKTTRYSNDVLSGKVVCSECGANYRRITRRNLEVVWRCANRVEHGSRICKESITISDNAIKRKVTEMFFLYKFDVNVCRKYLREITISNDLFVSVEEFNKNDMLKLREFQLKEAALLGDRKALNMLYEETYEKIRYIILDRIKRSGLSTYNRLMRDYEDLCQDILLKSFVILDKYHGQCRFSSWVARISFFEISHKLRSFRYREEVLIDVDDIDWLMNKYYNIYEVT